jgi:hypothetical protein
MQQGKGGDPGPGVTEGKRAEVTHGGHFPPYRVRRGHSTLT